MLMLTIRKTPEDNCDLMSGDIPPPAVFCCHLNGPFLPITH